MDGDPELRRAWGRCTFTQTPGSDGVDANNDGIIARQRRRTQALLGGRLSVLERERTCKPSRLDGAAG